MASPETVVSFEDIRFKPSEGGVRAWFLGQYYFDLSDRELSSVGEYRVFEGSLVFSEREKRVLNRFDRLLADGFSRLRNRVRDKPCTYVHRNSGIPLVGSNEFGVVDRGSNILEVKPLTGCNLSCTFCSVSEGANDKRDVVVELEYLLEAFKGLASLKSHGVEANIGPQGEPLLYPKLVSLVKGLKEAGAAVVSMNSNGTLLTEGLVDDLADAGLDRINLSLHSLDQSLADEIMGGHQDVARLQRIVRYCAGKVDVLLAPVLLPGVTDGELDSLVGLAKTIRNRRWPAMGVQNFLSYPGGRNPGLAERSWDDFYALLREKEREHGFPLLVDGGAFDIHSEPSPEKPFRKGDVVEVSVRAPGRNKNEWLCAAAGRVVTVRSCSGCAPGKSLKVRLLRDKHNIFTAVPS